MKEKRPDVRPNDNLTPSLFPSDMLLIKTYRISGPGEMVRKKTEKINVTKTSICIIFVSI